MRASQNQWASWYTSMVVVVGTNSKGNIINLHSLLIVGSFGCSLLLYSGRNQTNFLYLKIIVHLKFYMYIFAEINCPEKILPGDFIYYWFK